MAAELIPPAGLSRLAGLALETRERIQGGGTERTVAVALKLCGRSPLELDDLEAIVAAPAHPVTEGLVGGQEGRRWASFVLARIQAAREAEVPPVAEVRGRLARLAEALARIDRELRAQLTAAAATALAQALAHAGVKLRVRAAARRKKGATDIDGHTDALAAGTVTPALLAAVGVTERELVAGQFDAFAATADHIVADAQRRRRRALARLLRADEGDGWDEQETEHRDGAVALLAAGMLAVALERLHTPEPTFDERGEVPAIESVPPALVSDAVRASNGAVVVTSPGPRPTEAPLSVVGTVLDDAPNPFVAEAVGAVAPTAVIFQLWTHGEPARPFQPHVDLDGHRSDDGGVSWYHPDDGPETAVSKSFDEWPYDKDSWYPEDHDGCECGVTSSFGLDDE